MRLTVWDEIQRALRGRGQTGSVLVRDAWGQSQTVHAAMIACGLIALDVEDQRCRLCGHKRLAHSEVLAFSPCLDCDCLGWTPS